LPGLISVQLIVALNLGETQINVEMND